MLIAGIIIILILIIILIKMSIRPIIGAKEISYPYKSSYQSWDDILLRMKNLSKYKFQEVNEDFHMKNMDLFEIEKYYIGDDNPRKFVVYFTDDNYNTLNDIADYFTEPCRIRANVKYQDSVYNWWKQNNTKPEYKKKSKSELHEIIYVNGPKQLTNFKPSNLAGIIEMFGSTRILDFSSGWGDRLAAAMAKGSQIRRYVGVDPNPCLHPYYKKMIKVLNIYNVDINMIESMFETAQLPDETFDLVFTSPPYFDLEIYSENKHQSHHHGSLQDWYNNFLMVSIKKSWNVLDINGVMALNINDFGNSRYVQNMIRDINYFIDSIYMGVIMYTSNTSNNPQPIWIWRKSNTTIEYPSSERKSEILLDENDNLMEQTLIGKKEHKKTILFANALTPEIFNARRYGLDVILKSDYNPSFVIEQIHYNENTFNLIQDGYLPGGTKQRGLFEYIKHHFDYDEYVYAGPSEGFAQIALAYVCWRLGKKAVSFTDSREHSAQIKKAQSYGADCFKINGNLKQVQEAAKKYISQNNKRFLIPFGLDDEYFVQLMENNIREAISEGFSPNRLWLVAGSGTLLKIFSRVLPETHIIAIQVGKKIWADQIPTNAELMIAPEKFYDKPKHIPPYKTVLNYDGKIWQFVKKYGQPNDYILNVGML